MKAQRQSPFKAVVPMLYAPTFLYQMLVPLPLLKTLGSLSTLVWLGRISRAVHAERTPGGVMRASVLFARLFERRKQLGAWRGDGASPLEQMLRRRPSLVSVVRRPYIHGGWDASRRLAAVEQHYGQLRGRGESLRLRPLEIVRLATVGSADNEIDLVLDTPAWFIHEGELALNLFHRGERIYSLVFALGVDAGEPVAYVGAVQGLGDERALALYRTLTHALHGLRPRDLLMAAFRSLCRELGLARWLGVSNRYRVSCSPYFKSAAGVRSDYDEVWSAQGGLLRADGFHAMSVASRRRSHDEIPSRKRSAYRRRYEMLDRLDADLAAALGTRAEPALHRDSTAGQSQRQSTAALDTGNPR